MIRALARFDATRYAEVAAWPLGEALLALEDLAQQRELEQYRHRQLLYAQGALKKAPQPPFDSSSAMDWERWVS